MAFPSTLSTLIEAWHGIGGPFVSPGGNVYVVTRSAGGTELHMFKASDPSTAWSNAGTDFAMTSGNAIRHLAAYQLDDYIHVVTRDANDTTTNVIRYHAFNTSTDTWETTNVLIRNTFTCKSSVDEPMVGIIVRSLTSMIVLYEGPQVLADIQRARTYYARYMGTAWSSDIALDNGGNVDWYPQEMVLGSEGRVHFFFQDGTNGDYYQRCLTSANALESFPTAFDTDVVTQNDMGYHKGVAYSASAGGTVVRIPYFDNWTPEIADVRFTSADAPSPLTVQTDVTTSVNPYASMTRRLISYAKDDPTIYGVFTNTGQDLYIMSSQDAGSWSTPTLLLNATAAHIYTNCYVRNNNRVVGILFQDVGTDIKYTEYTLSTVAASSTIYPRMGLLGVGR